MKLPPTTHYTDSEGFSIAYQVFGKGEHDLLFVPGIISHLDLAWELDEHAAFLAALAETFRVIVFDKRGQGVSDRFDGAPSLEERVDDLRAVMKAAGSERSIVFGLSEGGPLGILFAATYPALVERLILFGTMARFTWAPDYPHRPVVDEARIEDFVRDWGTGSGIERWMPTVASEPRHVDHVSRLQRSSATPKSIVNQIRANIRIDVRALLPVLHTSTLVIHRRSDRAVDVGNGRYLADHIDDAIYLEVPGADHVPWIGDTGAIIGAIRTFANEPVHDGRDAVDPRRVAIALFTDIEDSTARMAELGDQRWTALLDRHDEISRHLVSEYRGEFIKSTGDGVLAVFDGPTRAVRCAQRLIAEIEALGIRVRAGAHAGEVEHRANKDLTGLAVHTAARVMAAAPGGRVLVTQTVVDLSNGGDIGFESRGSHALKGIAAPIALYEPSTDASQGGRPAA